MRTVSSAAPVELSLRRLLLVLALSLVGTVGLAAPASAAPCLLVPDLDGHVWTVCLG